MSDSPDEDAAAAFETVMAPLRSPTGASHPSPVPHRPQPLEDVAPPEGTDPVLRADRLCKAYDGVPALQNLTLTLYPGDVLGLLGPHGAGKTTTLRILATVLAPDAGTATVGGHPITDLDKARRQIGYMPDFVGVYDDLLVWEYMEFFARAYGVKSDVRRAAVEKALTVTGLAGLRERSLDGLSNALKQRLALARLLMHQPRLLLLDEPAAGLDQESHAELREILRGLRDQGVAILISSHRLEDLADLCNKVAILDRGCLLVEGAMGSLLNRLRDSRRWRLRVREPDEMERLHSFLKERADVEGVVFSDKEIYATILGGDEAVEQLHEVLFENGFRLLDFSEESMGLEELYQRLLGSQHG